MNIQQIRQAQREKAMKDRFKELISSGKKRNEVIDILHYEFLLSKGTIYRIVKSNSLIKEINREKFQQILANNKRSRTPKQTKLF